ncbi:TPA: dual OB domain-containing protein [Morganella morganii]
MFRRLVLLACSYRPGGRCVAGFELVDGNSAGWVRPVCSSGEGQVHDSDRICDNGKTAVKLSVVEVDVDKSQNHPMQRENVIFNHNVKWKYVSEYPQTHLSLTCFLESPHTLWENGFNSTNGVNDKVPVSLVKGTRQSLFFIKPTKLFIHIATEGEEFGNPIRKVRARFNYNNIEYMFSLMDADILDEFKTSANGEYEIFNAYMVVSLAGEYLQHYWKIAAAIIRAE